MFGASPPEKANVTPYLAFLALNALGEVVAKLFDGQAFWMASEPRYWIYPLQTLVCGVLLLRGWRFYEMRSPTRPLMALGIGALVFALWIAPQQWLGFAPRLDGFEPGFFGDGAPYALNVALRFLRLVVVVPLIEEIFWRGFLLRYLIRDDDFSRVPFGSFTWRSFAIVTVGFCFEHSTPDWPAALLTGALYNLVAYRTRSLSACVLAHALTNLLLGIYVLRTGQWGFW